MLIATIARIDHDAYCGRDRHPDDRHIGATFYIDSCHIETDLPTADGATFASADNHLPALHRLLSDGAVTFFDGAVIDQDEDGAQTFTPLTMAEDELGDFRTKPTTLKLTIRA